jgi:ABC-type multidrug transport system ATPase subunit
LLKPSQGSAKILGKNVMKEMDSIRHKIGYMSQKFSLYDDLTVTQNIRFYAGLYGISGQNFRDRLEEVVALTGIKKYLDFKAKSLSGGWKQRLALGCALVHEPEVIFLDEPTAGIDPVARRDLWDLLFDLSSKGITLFVTTHYMDEAERCHRVAYIYEGNLIADGSSNTLRNLDVITPEGFRRLEIVCKPLMSGYRLLKHEDHWIKDVTVFGTQLHALVSEKISNQGIEKLLAENGITLTQLQEIQPSLEDVFVTLTQNAIEENRQGS